MYIPYTSKLYIRCHCCNIMFNRVSGTFGTIFLCILHTYCSDGVMEKVCRCEMSCANNFDVPVGKIMCTGILQLNK